MPTNGLEADQVFVRRFSEKDWCWRRLPSWPW